MEKFPTNETLSILKLAKKFSVHTQKTSVKVIFSNSTGRTESKIVGQYQINEFTLNDNYNGFASVRFDSEETYVDISTP